MTTPEARAAERNALRQRMMARRAALPLAAQQQASEALASHIRHNIPPNALLGVYAAIRGEISLAPLIASLPPETSLAWPRALDDGQLAFVTARPEELRPGKYGILEPPEGPLLAASALDVMFVPGTAFSPSGGRLGMGGGYYDRYLASLRPDTPRVGVAYHWQILDDLPLLPHDLFMTHLVSDKEYIPCTPPRSESARPLP